jgi:ABC-2 type transport system ATP-binding protein
MNLGKLVAIGTPGQLKEQTKAREVLELSIGDGGEVSREMLAQFTEVDDVVRMGNRVLIHLTSGKILLPRIVEALTNEGVKIDSISLKEATLEDVFLNYTGRTLQQ